MIKQEELKKLNIQFSELTVVVDTNLVSGHLSIKEPALLEYQNKKTIAPNVLSARELNRTLNDKPYTVALAKLGIDDLERKKEMYCTQPLQEVLSETERGTLNNRKTILEEKTSTCHRAKRTLFGICWKNMRTTGLRRRSVRSNTRRNSKSKEGLRKQDYDIWNQKYMANCGNKWIVN